MINNINFNTNLESTQPELTLDNWVYSTLKSWANEGNSTKSKGTVLYEAMMFSRDDYVDDVSKIENFVNQELEKEGVKYNLVDDIIFSNITSGDLIGYTPEYDDPYRKVRNVQVWIPKEFKESLEFERYWNDRITDCLIHVEQSAFNDRLDRINGKKELLRYVRDNIQPEHDVIKNLVENNKSKYDIPDELIKSIETQEPIYERIDTFGWDDIEHCSDMTQWQDREAAIIKAFENESISFEDISMVIEDVWGITDKKYRQDKIKAIGQKYNIDIKTQDEIKEKSDKKSEDKIESAMNIYGNINKNNLDKFKLLNSVPDATPAIINELIHNIEDEITITELQDILKEADIRLPHEQIDMSDVNYYGTRYTGSDFEIWCYKNPKVKIEVNSVNGIVKRTYK